MQKTPKHKKGSPAPVQIFGDVDKNSSLIFDD